MILFYRITPFLLTIVSALGFASFVFRWTHPIVSIVITSILVLLLLGRLVRWRWQEFNFWLFLGTGWIFLLASFAVLFLFENLWVSIFLSIFSSLLLALFTEFVFLYIHLPSQYQPFSLEYLTLLLNLLSVFFMSCLGFALRLLVQVPLFALAVPFFIMCLFLVYGTLWVTKAESSQSRLSAFLGAVLLTELFVSVTFLPTGFFTNATFMTIFSYVFFGLIRTVAIHKLSPIVVRRYAITAICLFVIAGLSSQWL